MEQTHAYNGLYYVLMGRLSPLDGIGPKELAFEKLFARAADGRGQGSDPRHQLHQRGRGHRTLPFGTAACSAGSR
jgi:hypothetical protein